MDEDQWARRAVTVLDDDKEFSQSFSQQGLSHYAVKYNRFMGVISDYFLNEDKDAKSACGPDEMSGKI